MRSEQTTDKEEIIMWPYIFGGVVAVLLIGGLVYSWLRSKKIKENGLEAEAVISRIKEIEDRDEKGSVTYRYEYFVRYRNQAGETVEAKLGNPPRRAREGDQLRVKYLPEKPRYALAIQE